MLACIERVSDLVSSGRERIRDFDRRDLVPERFRVASKILEARLIDHTRAYHGSFGRHEVQVPARTAVCRLRIWRRQYETADPGVIARVPASLEAHSQG